jgi:hypothetical protein
MIKRFKMGLKGPKYDILEEKGGFWRIIVFFEHFRRKIVKIELFSKIVVE